MINLLEKTYNMYLKEMEKNKENSKKEIEDLPDVDHIFLESINDDDSDIIPENEYIPINIPNIELLGDTIAYNLTNILINNKK